MVSISGFEMNTSKSLFNAGVAGLPALNASAPITATVTIASLVSLFICLSFVCVSSLVGINTLFQKFVVSSIVFLKIIKVFLGHTSQDK